MKVIGTKMSGVRVPSPSALGEVAQMDRVLHPCLPLAFEAEKRGLSTTTRRMWVRVPPSPCLFLPVEAEEMNDELSIFYP